MGGEGKQTDWGVITFESQIHSKNSVWLTAIERSCSTPSGCAYKPIPSCICNDWINMAVLPSISQSSSNGAQCCVDWISVRTVEMHWHRFTMQQLGAFLHLCSGDLHQCSSVWARPHCGSNGSFEFNEVLCLCLCQVDFQLRLRGVCWCWSLLSIDHVRKQSQVRPWEGKHSLSLSQDFSAARQQLKVNSSEKVVFQKI